MPFVKIILSIELDCVVQTKGKAHLLSRQRSRGCIQYECQVELKEKAADIRVELYSCSPRHQNSSGLFLQPLNLTKKSYFLSPKEKRIKPHLKRDKKTKFLLFAFLSCLLQPLITSHCAFSYLSNCFLT